jgi:hypothetical protein
MVSLAYMAIALGEVVEVSFMNRVLSEEIYRVVHNNCWLYRIEIKV